MDEIVVISRGDARSNIGRNKKKKKKERRMLEMGIARE